MWPVIHLGFGYARLRYGVDLVRASPAEAVRTARVPILLIHGTSDTNIPPGESESLHALNESGTKLWLVHGAEHLNAREMDPPLYSRTVLAWFREHP